MKKQKKRWIQSVTAAVFALAIVFGGCIGTKLCVQANDLRYTGLRDVLNATPLQPESTGNEEIDAYLDMLLAQITTADMDTHDKLKACYDYLIHHTVYGVSDNAAYYWLMGQAGAGYGCLMEGIGVCDDYSAAFSILARRIGVPIYTTGGMTHKSDGGYTPHAWCEYVAADGTVYIFDPQIEDNIATKQGGISYLRFGGTYTQLADKYQKDTGLSNSGGAMSSASADTPLTIADSLGNVIWAGTVGTIPEEWKWILN